MEYKSIDSLEENPKDLFVKVSSLLIKLVENVLKNPTEPKYRRIRLGNQKISEVVLPSIGGMECLFEMGFVEADDSLYLPTTTSIDKLKKFHQALKSKIDRVVGQSSNEVPAVSTKSNAVQKKKVSFSEPEPIHRSPAEVFLYDMELKSNKMSQYEDKQLQQKALSLVPVSRIETSTTEQLRDVQNAAVKGGVKDLCEASTYEILFLKELMKWFKTEFFKWLDTPPCSICKCSTTLQGYSTDPEEMKYTSRVEVYYCNDCNKRELFPRYNDARLLLETRKGRCGEWAQCFTLFCRAFNYDTRFVNDNSDHVWTEVYSVLQNKWLHCDPCECVIDKPLMYEKGWNKKLDYVIAYSCDGVYDVTWRYSVDHNSTMTRRNLMPESVLMEQLNKLTQLRQQELKEQRKKYLAKRQVIELVEFLGPAKDSSDESYEGRTSGSLAWRLARGEIPTEQSTSSNFIWKPSSEEILARRMVVRYDAVRDEYVNGTGTRSIKGWDKGSYNSENIFRKEELDWKNVYLCRTEGSQTGMIVWKFEVETPNMVVDSVELTFLSKTYKSGSIRLMLCGGDSCLFVTANENVFKTNDLKGETRLTLKAELTGGEGDVAWQHAQLFRVSTDGNDSMKAIETQASTAIPATQEIIRTLQRDLLREIFQYKSPPAYLF